MVSNETRTASESSAGARGKTEWNLSKLRCYDKANQKSSPSTSAPWGYNEHQLFHLENLNSLPFTPSGMLSSVTHMTRAARASARLTNKISNPVCNHWNFKWAEAKIWKLFSEVVHVLLHKSLFLKFWTISILCPQGSANQTGYRHVLLHYGLALSTHPAKFVQLQALCNVPLPVLMVVGLKAFQTMVSQMLVAIKREIPDPKP